LQPVGGIRARRRSLLRRCGRETSSEETTTQAFASIAKTNEFRAIRSLAERLGHFVVGNGAPVVMLHSSLGSKSQWTALADRLASRFRVIALDLLGYGDNPASSTAAPFALDEEIRLVTAQLDHLVEPHLRVHLIGHSYGGLVALRFAQRMRGRVASLSLYEPVAFRQVSSEIRNPDIRRLAEHVVRRRGGPPGRRGEDVRGFLGRRRSHASLPPEVQDSMARRMGRCRSTFRRRGCGRRAQPTCVRSSCRRCC
jgi:pimeloyl-ACP methyl ester carboxylesterase